MKLVDWIYKIACWSFGALFIYSGTIKLLAPEVFAVLINAYGIIPEALIMPVAVALPAFEVLVGLGLILNIKGSLAAIFVLLLLFVAILTYGIWLGLDIDCGCFGPQEPEADAYHGLRHTLYRDLAMLAGIMLMSGLRRKSDIGLISLPLFIRKYVKIKERQDLHV